VLAESAPDVLLVNLPSAEYGATPLLAATRNSLPTLGLLHIHHDFERLSFRLAWVRATLARRAMRRLDTVCVLSPEAETSARKLWLRADVDSHIVPMPAAHVTHVDPDVARHRLKLPEGTIVGIAGRISIKQKGHDTLVSALPALVERVPDVMVAVAGAGRDEQDLRALVSEAKLEDRFRFLGPVEPIDDFLAAVDVLAVPSRFEGIPLVALEAAAAGRPAIVSSVDALRELWPREWQVPVDNPSALAVAIATLLEMTPESRTLLAEEARRCTRGVMSDTPSSVIEPLLVKLAGGRNSRA
jgi:glycosyltransferase involved in cell wall biosynthesis